MYCSKTIRETIADLINEANAINALAQEEQRELTPDEETRFSEILDLVGNNGDDGKETSGLHAKASQAEHYERIKAGLSKTTTPEPQQRQEPKIRVDGKKRKLRAFKKHEDAYACGQWLAATVHGNPRAIEWCNSNGVDIRAAQTEGTNSEGGFTVPDPLSSTIIDVMEEYGVGYRVSRQFPMTADSLNIPKRSSGSTVQYTAEAAAITESDKVWANVALATKTRQILTLASNELVADSVINVMDDLAMDAGRQLGLQADDEFINGDGTSTYGSETGLISGALSGNKHTLSSGETAWSDIVLTDFTTLMGKLGDKYFTGSSWIMSRQFYAQVVQALIYATGGNTASDITAAVQPQLYGYPIHFTEKMPADSAGNCACVFGNYSDAVALGVRQDVQVATSSDYAFNKNALAIRVTTRDDFNVHDNAAYATMFLAAS